MHGPLLARSDGGSLFGLLALLLGVGFVAYHAFQSRKAIRACGNRLGLARMRVDSETLSGDLQGMHLHVHFLPGSKDAPPHMAIEVRFAPCGLLLELRPQTAAESEAVAAGDAVDLSTGDARFDETWIVEGAPAARVLRLLANKRLRAQLFDYGGFAEARVTIEDGVVSLYRRGTDREDSGVNDARIELALALARAVAAESETALPEQETAEIDEAASTYRSAVRRPAGESASDRIQALKEKRGERRLRAARTAILVGHALVPGLAVAVTVRALTVAGAGGSQTLAILAVGGQLLATALSGRYLRRLRAGAPGVSFDRLTRGVVAGSWGVLGAVIAFLWLR